MTNFDVISELCDDDCAGSMNMHHGKVLTVASIFIETSMPGIYNREYCNLHIVILAMQI